MDKGNGYWKQTGDQLDVFLNRYADEYGEHTIKTLPDFSDRVKGLVGDDVKQVYFVFKDMKYLCSSDFGEIMRASQDLKERGVGTTLSRVPPKIARLIKIAGLDTVMPVLEEAVEESAQQ
jgi:anti-anti-sigma factor